MRTETSTLKALLRVLFTPFAGPPAVVKQTEIIPPPPVGIANMQGNNRLAAVFLTYASGGMSIKKAEVVATNGRVALLRFTPLGKPDPLIALPVVAMRPLVLGNMALLVDGVVRLAALGDNGRTSSYEAIAHELRTPLLTVTRHAGLNPQEMRALTYWWATFLAQPHLPMEELV